MHAQLAVDLGPREIDRPDLDPNTVYARDVE